MKKLFYLFFFLIAFSLSHLVSAEVAIEGETEFLDLIKGVYVDKKYEELPDKKVFKFENQKFKKYVDLIYDNDRKVIRFKPKREGSVTIRLVNRKDPDLIIKQIKVSIQKSNLDKVAKEIKSLLGEIEGIEIKVINNRVLVDGYILLAKDMNRIAAVLDQYEPSGVKSIVRLSPITRKKIAERIEAEIDNPNIYVTVINDFFVLEGSESYAGEKQNAHEIAQAHVSDILTRFAEESNRGGSKIRPVKKSQDPIINNILEVKPQEAPSKKIIQVVIHYVELSKSYGKGFNFSWAPALDGSGSSVTINGGSLSTTNILNTLSATITNLLPKLNWAREHGHARILNTLNVTTEEGQQGRVNSNDTVVRLQATAQGGSNPVPLEASVGVSVTPTILPGKRGHVRMVLSVNIQAITEVSEAGNRRVGNNTSTTVTVRDKQSAAVAGLLRSTSSTSYNRSPANEAAFFRFGAAKDLSRTQSQFVIFATPIIKANASEGIERIKKKFRLDK